MWFWTVYRRAGNFAGSDYLHAQAFFLLSGVSPYQDSGCNEIVKTCSDDLLAVYFWVSCGKVGRLSNFRKKSVLDKTKND
jgi:hypothetical protein